VNGARDTVLKLQVHFRNGVLGEHGGIGDVTNSGGLDHVSDGESLDSLVFGRASAAVGAANGLHMATTLLVTSIGRSLFDHFRGLGLYALVVYGTSTYATKKLKR